MVFTSILRDFPPNYKMYWILFAGSAIGRGSSGGNSLPLHRLAPLREGRGPGEEVGGHVGALGPLPRSPTPSLPPKPSQSELALGWTLDLI